MQIYSWNVNGLRAIEKKGFLEWIDTEKPDVICLQETKASPEQLSPALLSPPGYSSYWASGERKGYSGVSIYLTDRNSVRVEKELGNPTFDREGRVLAVHFKNFSLYNVYFPNGQMGEDRLRYKLNFYQEFMDYLEKVKKRQPNLVICGDFNTAHQEIDLKNPRSNAKRSGFLPVEREALDQFLSLGYVDVFRNLYPDKIQYTWWDYRTRARERNAGWRIDCFYVSHAMQNQVIDCVILDHVPGSDHCPVMLELK